MPLTSADVAAIADYARIALTDAELADMCTYLNDAIALLEPILDYDLADVEPTFHPVGGVTNVMRADEPVPGLSRPEALANAASTRDGCFRVPTILVDGGGA